jgi:hypothetical protein
MGNGSVTVPELVAISKSVDQLVLADVEVKAGWLKR